MIFSLKLFGLLFAILSQIVILTALSSDESSYSNDSNDGSSDDSDGSSYSSDLDDSIRDGTSEVS